MIKKIGLLLLVLNLTACTELQNLAGDLLSESGGLSSLEISNGLKEALNVGISQGAQRLSQKDGYFKSAYKILLPEEAQKVTAKLRNVPLFGNVENVILEKINRAAEDAAKSAKPIFVSAIKSMTFQDALSILMGEKNAATSYLDRATHDQLYQQFQPVIVKSLNKFNALDYWSDAVKVYNRLPMVNQLNPKLDDYITNKALDGLFLMVAKKELDIRNNIGARTTDLLKKVFAKQD